MPFAVVEFRAQDTAGNFLTGVDVEVRREVVGEPLQQIFADRDGLTPLGNPAHFADGIVRFYIAGGAYKITVSKSGVPIGDAFRHKAAGLNAETDGAGNEFGRFEIERMGRFAAAAAERLDRTRPPPVVASRTFEAERVSIAAVAANAFTQS